MRKFRKIYKNKILKLYNDKCSIKEISEILKISKQSVTRILYESVPEFTPLHRKYSLNDNIFLKDDKESFYWAGFLAADGCLKKHKGKYKRVCLGLSTKDIGHLEKFRCFLCTNKPISIYKKSCTVTICSNKIFDDLTKFNIVPRKSLVLTFPEWLIGHPLVNHFMRGYFDGDGCVSVHKNKKFWFSLAGTKEFLEKYNNIFVNNGIKIKNNKSVYFHRNIFYLNFGGRNILRNIRDFLYNNSDEKTRLDRKYNIFYNSGLEEKIDRAGKKIIGTNVITEATIIFDKMCHTKKYGFNPADITLVCTGKRKTHKGFYWKYLK